MLPLEDRPQRERKRFPYVMVGLVALNVLVFLFMLSLGMEGVHAFVRSWALIPLELSTGQDLEPTIPVPVYVTLLTSIFLHGGLLHLLGNMIFLWVFGDNVEDRFGHATFLGFYLLAGFAASAAHMLLNPMSAIPSLGASGAIAGVLGGYLLMFPSASVRTLLFFGPIVTIGRAAALILIGFWFLLQLVQTIVSVVRVTEEPGGVAFFAHVGGFLFGLVATGFILAARDQEPGTAENVAWSRVFRNWLLIVVGAGLVLGIAALLGVDILAGLTWLVIAVVALVDGLRRLAGRASLLGAGPQGSRLLAGLQLLLSVILLGTLIGALL